MSTNLYFYTITIDGKGFVAILPFYRWRDVLNTLKVNRDQVRRGAQAGLPIYKAQDDKAA